MSLWHCHDRVSGRRFEAHGSSAESLCRDIEEILSGREDIESGNYDVVATAVDGAEYRFQGSVVRTSFRLVLRDEWGSEHNVEFADRPTPEEIEAEAAEAADKELVLPEGGELKIHWVLFLGEEEIDSDQVVITVPPDHERLIRSAVRSAKVCGYLPEDHDWSSEGEGGLDQNPGVWSVGGTGILTREHCTECGLRREYYSPGVQALPGECDTVTYSIAEEEEV